MINVIGLNTKHADCRRIRVIVIFHILIYFEILVIFKQNICSHLMLYLYLYVSVTISRVT